MALINIETAIKRVQQIVRKLDPPQGVEILTYKRNRGVSIIKIDDDNLSVLERGYENNVFSTDRAGLAKLLKSIAKREFPRSRKVRVYRLDSPYCLEQKRKRI